MWVALQEAGVNQASETLVKITTEERPLLSGVHVAEGHATPPAPGRLLYVSGDWVAEIV